MITLLTFVRLGRILGYAVAVWSVCIFLTPVAAAQGIDVVFENTPLFTAAAIAPGFDIVRTVTVENTSTDTEILYVTVQNEISTGLAEVMELTIADTVGATYFGPATFSSFFATSPVLIGSLAPGATRVLTFTAQLASSTGNVYQATTMSFDILVGFEGGPVVVDTPSGGRGGTLLSEDDPDGVVAGESISIPAPTIAPPVVPYYMPTSQVLGVSTGKGSFGTPSYDEWRAALDRVRAEEQSLDATESGLVTQADTATSSDGMDGDGWTGEEDGYLWWLVLTALLMVLCGGRLLYRRFTA